MLRKEKGGEERRVRVGERAHLPLLLLLVIHHCLYLAPQTTGYRRRGRGEGEERARRVREEGGERE